ncbi:hypothetical protein BC829DRAFT_195816 [Chytridium lagenaria]|nr:hypothetical protein BC829DRAFT_195816 [Chytridium lagenaria]
MVAAFTRGGCGCCGCCCCCCGCATASAPVEKKTKREREEEKTGGKEEKKRKMKMEEMEEGEVKVTVCPKTGKKNKIRSRNYTCTFPDCHKTFLRNQDLLRHGATHMLPSQRPHQFLMDVDERLDGRTRLDGIPRRRVSL